MQMESEKYTGRIPKKDTSDPVISEINYFIEQYNSAYKKMDNLSKLTRTASILFAIWAAIFLSLFASDQLVKGFDIFSSSMIYDGYDINWNMTAATPLVFFAFLIGSRNLFKKKPNLSEEQNSLKEKLNWLPLIINIVFTIILFLLFTKEVTVLCGALSLGAFILTYMVNRLFGYTSSSVRNHTMVLNLTRLKREYEIASYGVDDKELKYIQEETFAHLFLLDEITVMRRDKEIMGDHYKVHDSAFSWVKGLRK